MAAMADRGKHVRLFRRAADQRLAAAEFLLQHGYRLEAVYLGGYAVECALKGLILNWAPQAEFAEVLEQLTEVGAKGHNFEYLKGLLKGRRGGRRKPDHELLGVLADHLPAVMSWSTDLRYHAGTVSAKTAHRFLTAARAIRDTCARS